MKGPHKYIKTRMCVGLLSSCVHRALHWGSAPVNCVPTGTEPLAVGWRSRAHSAPTTCLVPGRVTGLLQGGPPLWVGGGVFALCLCAVCMGCGIGGQLHPGRWESQGEQGASWSLGPSDLCHRIGLCIRGSQNGMAMSGCRYLQEPMKISLSFPQSICLSACPSAPWISVSVFLTVCLPLWAQRMPGGEREGDTLFAQYPALCSSLSVLFSKYVIEICNTSVS